MTPLVATYSIAAFDLAARRWGVAVRSRLLDGVEWTDPYVLEELRPR
jgi:hypothetical protein